MNSEKRGIQPISWDFFEEKIETPESDEFQVFSFSNNTFSDNLETDLKEEGADDFTPVGVSEKTEVSRFVKVENLKNLTYLGSVPSLALKDHEVHTGSSLYPHIRVRSWDHPYGCEICSKGFKQSGALIEHLRIHADPWPYKCEFCTESFKTAGFLESHLRTHADHQPFKCEICSKSFRLSRQFKDHLRVHTNQRPFKCEVCSKSFQISGNLKRRLPVHAGVRQTTCEVCSNCLRK